MTQERKAKLFDEALGWICECVSNDEDLFLLLHGHFEMTREELLECDIDLNEFFHAD